MKRIIFFCLASALFSLPTTVTQAAAPPNSQRTLSLTEALSRSLQQAGYEVVRKGETFQISRTGTPSLEAKRIAAQSALNTEVAYWNLYAAKKALSAKNRAVELARETVHACEVRRDAGQLSDTDVKLARQHYDDARKQIKQATSAVRESERQLSLMTGLKQNILSSLALTTAPSTSLTKAVWETSLKEALKERVELQHSRTEVRISQTLLLTEKYLRTVLGVPMDQMNLSTDAKVRLARSREILKDQETKVQKFLATHYRRLNTSYKDVRANRAQREAFGEQARVRRQGFLAGRESLDVVLESQRFWATALLNEEQSIAQYNTALACFNFARGATLIRHHFSIEATGSK